jgi:hypothetical protein
LASAFFVDPYVFLKKSFVLAANPRSFSFSFSFSLSTTVLPDCCCLLAAVSSDKPDLGSGDMDLAMLAAPPRPKCVAPVLGRLSILRKGILAVALY